MPKLNIQRVLLLFVMLFVSFGVVLGMFGVPLAIALSAIVLGFACASALYVLAERVVIERSLVEAAKRLDINLPGGSYAERLSSFLEQNDRHFRVSYVSGSERIIGIGDALYQVTSQAYLELPVRAVQLVLKDGSRALQVGNPKDFTSHFEPAGNVVEVGFANKTFGYLSIELKEGARLTASDKKILKSLALQAGMMLLDAQVSKELIRMTEISEDSLRAKAGFLANLSHEIRGPLGNILNGVELVEEEYCGPLTADQKKTLGLVRRSGSHLLDLVNDVLDYARVESGKLNVDKEPLEVNELLKDVSTLVRAQAVEKKHKLDVTALGEKMFVLCDRRHARQILINLLTNAIKYTKPGGEISIRPEVYDSRAIKIIVQDTGIGIKKEDFPKVFGSFERVDNQYALSQTGTGLGMPLTRKLVELNGGKIGFESEFGWGSSFWIVLPITEPQVETEEDDEPQKFDNIRANGESILLIDHNQETRDLVGSFLSKSGFNVVNHESAEGVIQKMAEEGVSLVVIEQDLPDLSGDELLTQIRSDARYGSIPVVVLSSRAFSFDIERFLRLGADRCFSKPVNLKELTSTLCELCSGDESSPE